MNAVADKLREARALIERRGWCQHDLEDARGRLCMSGAVSRVVTSHRDDMDAMEALRRAINAPLVFVWNDKHGRKQSEVLAAFDKAIELAEAGQ